MLTEKGVFLSTDRQGAVPLGDPGLRGLYWHDTRYLSGYDLRLNGVALDPLQSEDNGYTTLLTYATLHGTESLPGHLLLTRRRYLAVAEEGDTPAPTFYERITVTTYQRGTVELTLTVTLAADYRDILVVRGFPTAPGGFGTQQPPVIERDSAVLSYSGRDGITRSTTLQLSPTPQTILPVDSLEELSGRGVTATYTLTLTAGESTTIDLAIALTAGEAADGAVAIPAPVEVAAGLRALRRSQEEWLDTACSAIDTDSTLVTSAIQRALRDLRLLLLSYPSGPYIAAGIPLYAVPFGRDAMIVAIQTLAVNPDLAVGILRYLAAHQGRAVDPLRDETPGKILHEMRSGETVSLGLSPFGPYYGSVDSTPLFLVLLGRLGAWIDTGALIAELAPAVRAALDWLDRYGDLDGDGYIEFDQRAEHGLANQGWKDSGDSLQWPDGRYPQAPLALVEVQGYVYEARLAGATALRRLGDEAGAALQERKAQELRERFNRDFWLEGEHCFAQALDANKRAIPAVTSNAGHALWSGIADDERGAPLAGRLQGESMNSGWGLRTLASDDPSYDPLSYHNGSVWPHDTAIVAAGLKRYGFDTAALELCSGVLEAAAGFDLTRLPELYGGLPRERESGGPIPYPSACSPQGWAAGSVLHLLQTLLGLEPAAGGTILHLRPALPATLNRIHLQRLRLGARRCDLTVERTADGYAVRLSDGGTTTTATVTAGDTVMLQP